MNQIPLIVSSISLVPIRPVQGLLGFATCTISIGNYHFFIGDLSIRSRPDGGLRILYPQKTLVTGARVNCVIPLDKETAQAIEEPILKKFSELISKSIEQKVNNETKGARNETGKNNESLD